MPDLDLNTLATGFPHIPPDCGASIAQACLICLENQRHVSGVRLRVQGDFVSTFRLLWSTQVTEAERRYWSDLAEATEHAATGIAILLIRALTGYTVIERARKGTGFDWWLGTEDDLFQAKARLEVSGVLRGSRRRIDTRIAEKMLQTKQSDRLGLPAFVVVVEFSLPQARVVRR